jgi:hypothetical protein
MKKITIHVRNRNHNFRCQLQLDLFACRPTPRWTDNRAALLIAKRFGLSVGHAATVARLAGIGSHRES